MSSTVHPDDKTSGEVLYWDYDKNRTSAIKNMQRAVLSGVVLHFARGYREMRDLLDQGCHRISGVIATQLTIEYAIPGSGIRAKRLADLARLRSNQLFELMNPNARLFVVGNLIEVDEISPDGLNSLLTYPTGAEEIARLVKLAAVWPSQG